MPASTDLDRIRVDALDRIERSERRLRLAYVAAFAVEAALIGGFIVLGDLSQRVHVLLLLAAVGTYTIVLLGLLALAAHVSRSTQRVLQAIALFADAGGHGDPR